VRPPGPSSPSTLHLALQEGMEGVCPVAKLSRSGVTKAPLEELLGGQQLTKGDTLKPGNRSAGYFRQTWQARTGHRLRIEFP
jgi:hypothetical protein